MVPTVRVLDDLAVAEIEIYPLAVEQHTGGLQISHGPLHPGLPEIPRVLVARHADGGCRHGRVLRYALEAKQKLDRCAHENVGTTVMPWLCQ